jgi:hypothetical protein
MPKKHIKDVDNLINLIKLWNDLRIEDKITEIKNTIK